MDQWIGRTIGDYRIVAHLGSGGMGDVYKAEHVRLGREAVVKLLRRLSAGGSAVERFYNEARIQAELNHPGIAVLYEFNDACGVPCIIMEHVDGQTLSELVESRGRMPVAEALDCFAKIVEAIDYIHGKGIIHRDIKPHNIKRNRQGQIKLLDFGISKDAYSRNLTADGSFIGSEPYMAPEQLQGKTASAQSDIWALGVLLYEMVTGKLAFEAASWGELYKKILKASYAPPSVFDPSIPSSVTRIIDKCLKKQPSQRYASAKALLYDVNACRAESHGSGASKRKANALGRLSGAIGAPWRLVLAGLGFLLVGVLGVVAIFPGDPERLKGVQPPQTTQEEPASPKLEQQPSKEKMRTVRIDVVGSSAELYVGSGDELKGPHKTPYEGAFPSGSRVKFKLKRAKYQDCSGEFSVQDFNEANRYTYTMCQTGKYCPDIACK